MSRDKDWSAGKSINIQQCNERFIWLSVTFNSHFTIHLLGIFSKITLSHNIFCRQWAAQVIACPARFFYNQTTVQSPKLPLVFFFSGLLGICWKASRIGERTSPYVAMACTAMAFHVLFLKSWFIWHDLRALISVLEVADRGESIFALLCFLALTLPFKLLKSLPHCTF